MSPVRTILATLIVFTCASAHANKLYKAWTQEYDTTSTVSQGGRAVTTDARGNVFATGYAQDANSRSRFYTAKYDALDGHLVWAKFYAPNGDAPNAISTSNPSPMSIACDSLGNAIVTGSQNIAGSIDVVTIKYAAADGAVLWTKIYDGTAGGQDEGVKVAVDGNDDVIVTAKSVGSSAGFDIVTIKYAETTGNPVWASPDRYNATNRDDVPTDLAIDGSNNIVVVGDVLTASGEHSFYVRKLNSSGVLQWSKTLNTGLDGGATAVALNSIGTVFATGLYTNGSGHHGYYTVAYTSAGALRWGITIPPSASGSDFTGKPTDIAVGPDGNPVVTGYLQDDAGTEQAYTVKFDDADNGAVLGLYDLGLTDPKTGEAFGDTRGKGVVVDGANNIIIVGESDGPGFDSDLFVTKYSSDFGERLFFDSYNGTFDSTDVAFGIARDGSGGVAIAAEPTRKTSSGTGRGGFFVRKYNRFIAATGDKLTDIAKYSTGNAPAIADSGAVAAKVTVASGAKKLAAIFTQGVAGGTVLPAVQGDAAPGVTNAKFASFSDPLIAPNGQYAFAAKVTGAPVTQASGVWTNLGGTLHLALQTGKPIPGLTENLVSVMSLSLVNGQLLALVKVVAPATSNVALVAIDAANNGTLVRRTGQTVNQNGVQSTITKLSVLTPPKTSPGDGRWHGAGITVVKATLADKRTAIFHSTQNPGELVTGGPNFNPKSFGLPGISAGGIRFATVLTQNVGGAVTAANDTLLVRYSPNSLAYETVAAEGGTPANASFNGTSFVSFSDPIIDTTNRALFLATIKGTGVTTANSKVLFHGVPGSHTLIARTGSAATDSTGATGTPLWSSITNFALPNGRPLFVAKLAGAGITAKNNLGVWGVDSLGAVRRILRTGDVLGTQTVKSFTLLKAVSGASTAARSYNNTGSVAALVSFTDGKQALVKLGLP